MRSILLKCIIILILALSPIAVQAVNPHVTATYRQVDEGYLYQFTVHNTSTEEIIYDWFVSTTNATHTTSPEGWSISQNFRSVSWYTDTHEYVIQPGSSLGGFGFTTPTLYTTFNFGVLIGTGYLGTVSPTPVPEPTSLLALAAGTAGLLIRKRRHNP